MNKNVIIDITSYIRHLTKMVIKVSLAMILAVEMLSGSITGVWKGFNSTKAEAADNDTITLRICNWEEYIDEGGWNADETIDLESTDIRGDNSMVDDFVQWYYKTYGKKVNVEYSCLGTNEELYNMLTLGDEYDLICPSEYMFMKLMTEGWLEPFSDEFDDTGIKENYYAKGVSPFIKQTFDNNTINGEPWSKYAAGYMWGVTGIIYNPEDVTKQEASTWKIINNDKFRRMITVKDNVRDTMFAAIGAIKSDKLRSQDFIRQADYTDKLAEEMNDTSKEMHNMGTAIIIGILAIIVVIAVISSVKHMKGEGGCCGGGGDTVAEERKTLDNPVIAVKTVDIEGMHCENCKNSIERSVNKIDGASCQVNLKKKQATIEVDREIDDADIRIAIERLDFKVTGITTNSKEK